MKFSEDERQNGQGANRTDQERENIPSGRGRGEISSPWYLLDHISDVMALGKRGPSKRGRKKAAEGRGGGQPGVTVTTPGPGQNSNQLLLTCLDLTTGTLLIVKGTLA